MQNASKLNLTKARQIWINACLLNANSQPLTCKSGSEQTQKLIEHLGYVQIDTIFVIERCHHHILFNRFNDYHRKDLKVCQSQTKSIFEYWTHALAYIPTKDITFYMKDMKSFYRDPSTWYSEVQKTELAKLIRRIKSEGPISMRDMDDSIEGKKNDWWISAKPSKKVLQYGFYSGKLTISERVGMLKKYELFDRHFGFDKELVAPSESARINYLIDRSLKSQGVVSLESICHLNNSAKKSVLKTLEQRVKNKSLVPVALVGSENWKHWTTPELLDTAGPEISDDHAFLLSPFDPLIIQRKRAQAVLSYNHIFEAYVPEKKRKYGYFTLPVLIGDQIVAGLDLKTDRQNNKLIIQSWHWFQKKNKTHHKLIEKALHNFEKFQLDWRTT